MHAYQTILINLGRRYATQNTQNKQNTVVAYSAEKGNQRMLWKQKHQQVLFLLLSTQLPAATRFFKRYLIPTFKKNFSVFLSVHSGISPISLE